jgi:hypothetical protein
MLLADGTVARKGPQWGPLEAVWAWRPAMRGPVSTLVARSRSGAKIRASSSVAGGRPVAASAIRPSTMYPVSWLRDPA